MTESTGHRPRKGYTPLRDQGNAWHKLQVMLRWRMTDTIDEIERLAEQAGCDVSYEFAYEQEREGELIPFGVVNSIRSC